MYKSGTIYKSMEITGKTEVVESTVELLNMITKY